MFHSKLESINPWKFIFLPQTQSTHIIAKLYLANASPKRNIAVFTDHQTDGVGQYGREWSSQPLSNLTVSLAFPFSNQQVLTNPFIWNMYIANVVHQSLTQICGASLSIKWPNDIMQNGKKIGGILVHNTYAGPLITSSLVGIGVNVNQGEFPTELANASSLKIELGQAYNPLEILMRLTSSFVTDRIIETINKNSTMILNLYNRNLYKRGEMIICEDSESNIIQGLLEGVNTDGKLMLTVGNAKMTLNHGDYRQLINRN